MASRACVGLVGSAPRCSTSYAASYSAPPPAAAALPLRRHQQQRCSRRATVAVRSSGSGAPHPDPSVPLYPSAREEAGVSHDAFLHAMEAARPRAMHIPGMNEFAAALWQRRRIPSASGADPLDHIFSEFDADSDGKLSAAEIARALVSRGVDATEAQVGVFIDASDTDDDGLVSRDEFPAFVFKMASANARSVSAFATGSGSAGGSSGGGAEGAVRGEAHIILPPQMGGSPGSASPPPGLMTPDP